jgi:hypothetical protein
MAVYEHEAKEMLECLIRAIEHFQRQAELLNENPPKRELSELEFTDGIIEIADEDMMEIANAVEGLANSIRDALGSESRHAEIKELIDNNQQLVNSCIDSYVANLEEMKSSINEVFAPALPKLSSLGREFDLAKKTQKAWWKAEKTK